MVHNRLSAMCFAAAMTFIAPVSFGNDLVDFLRAVNGPRHHHPHHSHVVHHSGSHRVHRHAIRPYKRSVSIHIGHTTLSPIYNPRPVIHQPLLLAPAPSSIGFLPHELGEIVTCDVPLEPHVRIRNGHEIAPHAQPVIMAVRNPHLAAWGSPGCIEGVTYVQIFVPTVPLQHVTVSRCRTRIDLDYGDWEIKIRSRDGIVEVEYDD